MFSSLVQLPFGDFKYILVFEKKNIVFFLDVRAKAFFHAVKFFTFLRPTRKSTQKILATLYSPLYGYIFTVIRSFVSFVNASDAINCGLLCTREWKFENQFQNFTTSCLFACMHVLVIKLQSICSLSGEQNVRNFNFSNGFLIFFQFRKVFKTFYVLLSIHA